MPTKIANCSCSHAFQDQEYGKGMRVFNTMAGKPGNGRCTVCGQTKGIAPTVVVETKKKKGK
jgi:hypothetical protein